MQDFRRWVVRIFMFMNMLNTKCCILSSLCCCMLYCSVVHLGHWMETNDWHLPFRLYVFVCIISSMIVNLIQCAIEQIKAITNYSEILINVCVCVILQEMHLQYNLFGRDSLQFWCRSWMLVLQARIKKIMQSDDEVGKVAAPVPVIISRALEMFAETLLHRARKVTSQRGARTLTPSHLWVVCQENSSTL